MPKHTLRMGGKTFHHIYLFHTSRDANRAAEWVRRNMKLFGLPSQARVVERTVPKYIAKKVPGYERGWKYWVLFTTATAQQISKVEHRLGSYLDEQRR